MKAPAGSPVKEDGMVCNDRLVSIFDVLGPIMTGPSSSHTAGVLRIGRVGRMFLGGDPERIDLHFHGNALARTYKGHMSDSAVVAGLLGFGEDYPRLRYALDEAARRGISVTCHSHYASKRDPNTVDMELRRGGDVVRVVGITMGGGEILVTEFGPFSICLRGDETGVIFIAGPTFDGGLLETLQGGAPASVSISENGEDRLFTCLFDESPPSGILGEMRGWAGVKSAHQLENVLDYRLRDSEPLFSTVEEMIRIAGEEGKSIAGMAVEYEAKRSGLTGEQTRARIGLIWARMKESLESGLKGPNDLLAGFIPNDEGARMLAAAEAGKTLGGPILGKAIGRAIAVMETNACAKCVVAAPTAGSCGVLPGTLVTVAEALHADEDAVIDALLTAAMMGTLIAMRASLSGSMGGCQAEIGVASAMTASALVEIAGGSPRQTAHAMSLALKNLLGLICDPVAGPVEIPCVKRNSVGVANAFAAADMALVGLESAIPPDEVIDALVNTQKLLPAALKGSMLGGLGSTPTAKRLKAEWDLRVAIPHEMKA